MLSECHICLETVGDLDDTKTNIFCFCKTSIHLKCLLQCIKKYERCPTCNKSIKLPGFYFIGINRNIADNIGIFSKYINNIPVKLDKGNYYDLGPWSKLDKLIDKDDIWRIHQKQLLRADYIIVNLSKSAINSRELKLAINNGKALIIINKSDIRSMHHKYIKYAISIFDKPYPEFLFKLDPINEYFDNIEDYNDTIQKNYKKSLPFYEKLIDKLFNVAHV